MTTDAAALQERIARILNDEGWTFEGVHEPGDYDECEDCRLAAAPIAARIAQTVAAEVQAAKAEALREAARYFVGGLHCSDMRSTPEETVRELNRRATEHDKEAGR